MARNLFREDGDMREARSLLRGALMQSHADYGTIYRGWISMEANYAGNVDAARVLFLEWRLQCGGKDSDFWCQYIAFESRHDSDRRARDVAEVAVAACPEDPAVHAMYNKTELRLGREDRAFTALARALAVFAKDSAAQEWLVDEVRGYRNALRRCGFAGLLRACWRCVRPSRTRHGYERLPH
ncbi:hypothetical protein ABZP36_008963 [Zizania latifolia]